MSMWIWVHSYMLLCVGMEGVEICVWLYICVTLLCALVCVYIYIYVSVLMLEYIYVCFHVSGCLLVLCVCED